jgi:hypothetical protein
MALRVVEEVSGFWGVTQIEHTVDSIQKDRILACAEAADPGRSKEQ